MRGSVYGRLAVACICVMLGGCADKLRVSLGTRMPDEHRGASSVQLTERFSRVARGEQLSVVATLMDFSYLRALTRERSRLIEVEREAYDRYLRRKTSFYVYVILHEEENCRPGAHRAERRRRRGDRTDLRNWTFVMRTPDGRERDASEVEQRATQLAPTGGCLVQGYVTFDGNIPRTAQWVALDAANQRDDDNELTAELRWDLESWTPPRRRPGRRPEREPETDDDEDS